MEKLNYALKYIVLMITLFCAILFTTAYFAPEILGKGFIGIISGPFVYYFPKWILDTKH